MEALGSPQEEWRDIYIHLIRLGVSPQRALELAATINRIDMTGWSASQLDRYIQQWAEVAVEEENQARYAMYGAYYDPRTGRPWSEFAPEERDPNVAYRIMGEQAGITGAHRYRAQQAAERERQWYEGVPERFGEMPTYAQVTAPALEEMRGTPAMRRYYEREFPGMYGAAGMPAARRRWWGEKTKYPEPGMPEAQEVWEAEEEPAIRAEMGWVGDLVPRKEKQPPDPWARFLSKFKSLERWRSLTPKERGVRTGTFRPRTRFL